MSQFKPITFDDEFVTKYWDGPTNKIVRWWIYLRGGLSLFNEWKNYLLLAFGSYWTIKTADFWISIGISDTWLAVGVLIAMPLGIVTLLFLGRWQLFKTTKPAEFITARHASITGYQGFNMTVRMVELLEEINNKLGKEEIDIRE